jgi:hypothetical protein
MPITLANRSSNTNSLLKKNKYDFNISGLKEPKIIIQEGRNFTIVKETRNKNDKDNLGVVINEGAETEIKVMNNINQDFEPRMAGGDAHYYEKYMKYKIKYLALKKQEFNRNF